MGPSNLSGLGEFASTAVPSGDVDRVNISDGMRRPFPTRDARVTGDEQFPRGGL
jgi:hypothetical protein